MTPSCPSWLRGESRRAVADWRRVLALVPLLALLACTPEPNRLGVRLPADASLAAGCAAETARDLVTFQEALASGAQRYANLCQLIGPPDERTGSGFAILIYHLADGSEVWLAYGGLDHLAYARHYRADGDVVELFEK